MLQIASLKRAWQKQQVCKFEIPHLVTSDVLESQLNDLHNSR
jgi:hypothetical protein